MFMEKPWLHAPLKFEVTQRPQLIARVAPERLPRTARDACGDPPELTVSECPEGGSQSIRFPTNTLTLETSSRGNVVTGFAASCSDCSEARVHTTRGNSAMPCGWVRVGVRTAQPQPVRVGILAILQYRSTLLWHTHTNHTRASATEHAH